MAGIPRLVRARSGEKMSDCPICENPAHLNFHPSSPFVELKFRAAALMELVEDQLPRVKYAATLPSSIVLLCLVIFFTNIRQMDQQGIL